MLLRLGRLTARKPRLVLAGWAAVFVLGLAAGPLLFSSMTSDMGGGSGTESARADERRGELLRTAAAPADSGPELYAVVDGAPVDDPAVRIAVLDAVADLEGLPLVVGVLDAYRNHDPRLRSVDGQASAVVVRFAPSAWATDGAVDEARSRLEQIAAPRVLVGNEDMVDDEISAQAEEDLVRGEAIALPIAFIAMVALLGGVLAAGLPVLLSLASVGGALLVLLAASAFGDVAVYSINVVTMFGIGLGIDYGLLIMGRFREERAAGRPVPEALDRTTSSAGITVAYSGLTVAVSLAGLLVFDSQGLRSLAIGGMGVVLLAVLAAVTLLPAMLALVGHRIPPARPRAAEGRGFARVAAFVQRRAPLVVVATAALLLLAAVPFARARFEQPDARSLPRSSTVRQLEEVRRERFADVGIEPVQIVAEVAPTDPSLRAYATAIEAWPEVAAVSVLPLPGGTATEIEVEPRHSGQAAGEALVHRLRDGRPGFTTLVTGDAAELVDQKAAIAARLPLALALVMLGTLVVLFLMTGSVVVAVKAVVMNVLSLGATFGALVLVFQDGHLTGLLGFDSVGALDATIPLVIFIFAFGLSMDYEVFLLSRIREAWIETGDNSLAVRLGLQRSGRIITSAALLIVIVFAGFAAGGLVLVKQLGVGLAVAVIVDATVVRLLLVPATMSLLGTWNWWAPAPLRRLHERFGLHEPPAASTPLRPPSAAQAVARR